MADWKLWSETTQKPKLGSHCFLKCKDGYKFAEFARGEEIHVGDGWDDQGRLKITCKSLHWSNHGWLDGDQWNPTQWNLFTKVWGGSGRCWKMPETTQHHHACHKFPQCIPNDSDP